MRERPILFNDAMVRAILSGAKARTRRPVLVGGAPVHHDRTEGAWRKLRDGWAWVVENDVRGGVYPCPFGAPGDTLWVREAHAPRYFDDGRAAYRADYNKARVGDIVPEPRWTPSIHMRRADSRLTLRVTDVRVERVQDITNREAIAEGIASSPTGDERDGFRDLWASVYGDFIGAESWAANPWVWVVSFEREVPRG